MVGFGRATKYGAPDSVIGSYEAEQARSLYLRLLERARKFGLCLVELEVGLQLLLAHRLLQLVHRRQALRYLCARTGASKAVCRAQRT